MQLPGKLLQQHSNSLTKNALNQGHTMKRKVLKKEKSRD